MPTRWGRRNEWLIVIDLLSSWICKIWIFCFSKLLLARFNDQESFWVIRYRGSSENLTWFGIKTFIQKWWNMSLLDSILWLECKFYWNSSFFCWDWNRILWLGKIRHWNSSKLENFFNISSLSLVCSTLSWKFRGVRNSWLERSIWLCWSESMLLLKVWHWQWSELNIFLSFEIFLCISSFQRSLISWKLELFWFCSCFHFSFSFS